MPILDVQDLTTFFHTRNGVVRAVDGVSFTLERGETLGIVGESGSGKSVSCYSLMGLIPQPPGRIESGKAILDGEIDLLSCGEKALRRVRGKRVSMIFQDPMTSLNPVQRVDEHIVEAIQIHEPKTKMEQALERAKELLQKLGIQSNRITSYPHQLSGGMRQRVMVGLGLVLNADLIIADEATTSLDVIVEAKLADQLKEIRDEFGVSLLVITHNIALVAELADRVAVMYAGHIVELGSVEEIFDNPQHPYTKGLLLSVPTIKLNEREDLYKMDGEPPNLTHPPHGCRFHPRCPKVMPICEKYEPEFLSTESGRFVKCWLYQDHPEKESEKTEVSK